MPWGTEDWGRHTIGSPFMVVKEREIWIYHDVGRGHTNRTYKTPKPKQISMARLRRDGFAGYTAGNRAGWIETAPFTASGELKINADASKGEVRIEVFEVEEKSQHHGKRKLKPLANFSSDKCIPLGGDVYVGLSQWKDAKWAELEGKLVTLRIHMKDATLYSFRVTP